jgi:hypothetical protein
MLLRAQRRPLLGRTAEDVRWSIIVVRWHRNVPPSCKLEQYVHILDVLVWKEAFHQRLECSVS